MHPAIQNLVRSIPRGLGSYAPIIQEVESVLSDPQSNLVKVGEVIEKDPDLTARLLRLGNSAFYGFPARLETVSEAVSLIGTQQVQDLLTQLQKLGLITINSNGQIVGTAFFAQIGWSKIYNNFLPDGFKT